MVILCCLLWYNEDSYQVEIVHAIRPMSHASDFAGSGCDILISKYNYHLAMWKLNAARVR